MLIINIKSIKNDRESLKTEIPGKLFNPIDETIFEDLVAIDLQLYRSGEKIVITGKARTTASLCCSRCLVDYRQPISTDVLFVIQPKAMRWSANKQLSDRESDNGILPCQGDQMDLVPEIRNLLILALPMKPLCQVACQGLCSQCGVNLNLNDCRCTAQQGHAPFAALQTLIGKREFPGETSRDKNE